MARIKVIIFWCFACVLAHAQTDPTGFVFGSFSSIAPYNHANGYTIVPDSQLQPSTLILDNNTFPSSGAFTILKQDDPSASFAVSGNQGTITTTTATGVDFLIGSSASSFSGPDMFAEMEVDQNGSTSGTDQLEIGFSSSTVQLSGGINISSNQCYITVYVGGTYHGSSPVACSPPAVPWKLGVSLIGSWVGLWLNNGTGWQYQLGEDISGIYDPTLIGNLTGLHTSFKTYTSLATTWKVSNLKTSVFGGTGVRDISTVTNPDGTPYVAGSLMYFMATVAGPNGTNESSEGLFSLNLNTLTPTFLSAVLTQRGGHIYNDSAGQLIYNTVTKFQQYLISTWANNSSPSIMYQAFATSSQNLLNGGVFLIAPATTISQTDGHSNGYDPFLTCTSFNYSSGICSNWLLAYTGLLGLPGLQSSTSDPTVNSWTFVGSEGTNCEGSRIQCLVISGTKTYFPAWGCTIGSTSRSTRVFNSSFSFIGGLNVTLPPAYGADNPPHANIFAYGNTEYFLTFDNSLFSNVNGGNMGNLILATASLTTANACYATNPVAGWGVTIGNSTIGNSLIP